MHSLIEMVYTSCSTKDMNGPVIYKKLLQVISLILLHNYPLIKHYEMIFMPLSLIIGKLETRDQLREKVDIIKAAIKLLFIFSSVREFTGKLSHIPNFYFLPPKNSLTLQEASKCPWAFQKVIYTTI